MELDKKKLDEIFNRVTIPKNIKIVEFNEFNLPKDTSKEVLKYATVIIMIIIKE